MKDGQCNAAASAPEAAHQRDLMRRLLAAHAAHALPINILHPAAPAAPLSDEERLQRQRGAIADVLRRAGLASADRTLVEFGSGDGSLSRSLQSAGVAGRSLLVDRNKQRMSRAGMADTLSASTRQVCADVASLRPEALREEVPDECVVVSNHLCGSALDMALRCALDAWPQEALAAATPRDDGGRSRLVGIAAVTCCHHSCNDMTFLGTDFLRETCGLSAADLVLTRKWSLMAPRRERPAEIRSRVLEAARTLGVTPSEAAQLGACCRALMDSARAVHLRQRGFAVCLVNHVPFELTADNVMLLATRMPTAGLTTAGGREVELLRG